MQMLAIVAGDDACHVDLAGLRLDGDLRHPGAPHHAGRTALVHTLHLRRGEASTPQHTGALHTLVICRRHPRLLHDPLRQRSALPLGQVLQPPRQRIFITDQRLLMPEAFLGEHLGRVKHVDAGT
ncbi:hypothetical protein G6F31_020276 [Rhizopus arrhizus]|nr:hypothetical protein G6F31_020276 [Rhizopus arrhizus]